MEVEGYIRVVEMGKRERMSEVKIINGQGIYDLYFRDYGYRI